HQALDPGRWLRARETGLRLLHAEVAARLSGPLPDPPALWGCLRLLAGDGGPLPGGPGARDRGQQLPPGPDHGPDRPQPGRAGGEPDRDALVLPADRDPEVPG